MHFYNVPTKNDENIYYGRPTIKLSTIDITLIEKFVQQQRVQTITKVSSINSRIFSMPFPHPSTSLKVYSNLKIGSIVKHKFTS